MRAPRVVAKGALLVAERIAELARDNGVPVLRAPPLARALFAHAEVGREIPGALYNAVAEVLAWVYQLRRFEAGDGERPPSRLRCPSRRSSILDWQRKANRSNRKGAEAQRTAENARRYATAPAVRRSAGLSVHSAGVFSAALRVLCASAVRGSDSVDG